MHPAIFGHVMKVPVEFATFGIEVAGPQRKVALQDIGRRRSGSLPNGSWSAIHTRRSSRITCKAPWTISRFSRPAEGCRHTYIQACCLVRAFRQSNVTSAETRLRRNCINQFSTPVPHNPIMTIQNPPSISSWKQLRESTEVELDCVRSVLV